MSTKWWTENSSNLHTRERETTTFPRRSRWKKGACVALLSMSLVAASGCSLLPAEAEEEVLPAITPSQISKKPEHEVTTTTLKTEVKGTGNLISMQEETLFFTMENKRLKSLNVKVGDVVKAGDVIGELDVDDMVKDLRLKHLQFRSQEVQMKETLRQRDEMDPVKFEEAVIVFEQGRQALTDLEEDIAKATLVAPFSGTVVSLTAKKGDTVKAYDPICIIADTSKLTVAATVAKDKLASIAVGMPVTVDINNAGQFTGKLKQLPMNTEGNNGNNGGGAPGGGDPGNKPENFVLVDLDKAPEGLNRGTPLSITIVTKRKENAVVIPISALRTIGARTYVQVVDENGKREVDVGVGQQTSTQIEILEGLQPGQKVVGR
ncbi:HlyD family efflux transporter periplasmic adaptor subunit [Paenibacillaceae bacterium]|nr:HlyD family efflux transporter periplasmic adaptor subunit [Paenibacillaceae bacterium]